MVFIDRRTATASVIEWGWWDNDTIYGSAFDDRLKGAQGDDSIRGEAGDDFIIDETYTDGLFGPSLAGDNSLYFIPYPIYSVHFGLYQLPEMYESDLAKPSISFTFGKTFYEGGADSFYGGAGDDILSGLTGNDSLDGGADNDTIWGGAGGDTLLGGTGSGKDILYGNDGSDIVDGGGGDDYLFGGNGDDSLFGGTGADRLIGGSGTDVFFGGAGGDIILGDGLPSDYLDSGILPGSLAFEQTPIWLVSSFNSGITESGNDAVSYAGSTAVDVDLRRTGYTFLDRQRFGDAEGDVLFGIEHVIGSSYNDTLRGDANANRLTGRTGDDLLEGGYGADTLDGGIETGSDPGSDTASYSSSNEAVDVDLGRAIQLDGHAQGDILISIENVSGSEFNDMLRGDEAANRLSGSLGRDTMEGRGGADHIFGYSTSGIEFTVVNGINVSVSDTASYASSASGVNVDLTRASQLGGDAEGDVLDSIEDLIGSFFADELRGDDANNVFTGGDGNDTLVGRSGSDILTGGKGTDYIDGGADGDVAVYAGIRANYMVRSAFVSGNFNTVITDAVGTDGGDGLVNIEALSFNGSAYGLHGVQQNLSSNIDGQRYDDVLFQNSVTGQIIYQNMTAGSGGGFVNIIIGMPQGWKVFSSADITGDGRAETFLHDVNTGSIYAFNKAPAATQWTSIVTGFTSNFKPIATGDVTRDGVADFIVRNNTTGEVFVGDINAGGTFGGFIAMPSVGTGWRTVGLGDFNADGASDILIQNIANGTTYYRDMVNNAWGVVSANIGGQWLAKEAADLNGDGYCDVVFRNSSNGNIWYVDMLGGSGGKWTTVANGLTGWDVKTTADVDNDGYRDVIIQNTTDGTTYYAEMNDGAFKKFGVVTSAVGTDWLVV